MRTIEKISGYHANNANPVLLKRDVANQEIDVIEGDILMAFIATNINVTITPPANWVSIDQVISGSMHLEAFYKICGSNEANSYSFSVSAGTYRAGILFGAYRYADLCNPVYAAANALHASNKVDNAPEIFVVNDCAILRAYAFTHVEAEGDYTYPSYDEKLFRSSGNAVSGGVVLHTLLTYDQTQGGSTGTPSVNATVASINGSLSIGVKPIVPGYHMVG
jgi:hypothetical protein